MPFVFKIIVVSALAFTAALPVSFLDRKASRTRATGLGDCRKVKGGEQLAKDLDEIVDKLKAWDPDGVSSSLRPFLPDGKAKEKDLGQDLNKAVYITKDSDKQLHALVELSHIEQLLTKAVTTPLVSELFEVHQLFGAIAQAISTTESEASKLKEQRIAGEALEKLKEKAQILTGNGGLSKEERQKLLEPYLAVLERVLIRGADEYTDKDQADAILWLSDTLALQDRLVTITKATSETEKLESNLMRVVRGARVITNLVRKVGKFAIEKGVGIPVPAIPNIGEATGFLLNFFQGREHTFNAEDAFLNLVPVLTTFYLDTTNLEEIIEEEYQGNEDVKSLDEGSENSMVENTKEKKNNKDCRIDLIDILKHIIEQDVNNGDVLMTKFLKNRFQDDTVTLEMLNNLKDAAAGAKKKFERMFKAYDRGLKFQSDFLTSIVDKIADNSAYDKTFNTKGGAIHDVLSFSTNDPFELGESVIVTQEDDELGPSGVKEESNEYSTQKRDGYKEKLKNAIKSLSKKNLNK